MKNCKTKDCPKPIKSRGYCSTCYERNKRQGKLKNLVRYKTCTVDGCDRSHKGRGFCEKHLDKFKKYGDPLGGVQEAHGLSHTPEYGIWKGIKKRCFDPTCDAYHNYGGRGIIMSDEFLKSFTAFIEHVGFRPNENYSIDRIDNNKGYIRDNLRWATGSTQTQNTRLGKNNKSGCKGVVLCKAENTWVASIGVNGERIHLGRRKIKEEAIKLRILGELEHWGYIQQKQFEYLLDDK